jgi:putative PIN family toxin of toxin-antitoxin system
MDRVVFDCMVYLQAVANESSPAFACFNLVDADRIQPCLSEAVLAEVREVLNRPKLQMKFRRLTPERIAAFIWRVQTKGLVVDDVPRSFTFERDPDDEKYVNLALAAGASFIVSRDKDLLSLMSDEDFRNRFPRLTIVDPVEFLRIIRTTNGTQGE